MGVNRELIDKLLKGHQKPQHVIGGNGLLKPLTNALLEGAMNTE